jgi:hypothetical protein
VSWRCPTCGRSFRRSGQPHSCRVITVEEHFRGKPEARALLDRLLTSVADTVGPCEVIALPCCIHLARDVDFLAVLPKRHRLELRFALDRDLPHPRVVMSVPVSSRAIKHCVDVTCAEDLDDELLSWIREAADRVAAPSRA